MEKVPSVVPRGCGLGLGCIGSYFQCKDSSALCNFCQTRLVRRAAIAVSGHFSARTDCCDETKCGLQAWLESREKVVDMKYYSAP